MPTLKISWLTLSSGDVPAILDWLHPSERALFSKFKFPQKQQNWLQGRWTAKNAVIRFLKNSHPGLSLTQFAILPASDGAPEVYFDNQTLPVSISLSHSHELGFCTLAQPGFRFGCDLEKIESRSPLLSRDYFTEKEQAIISATDIKDQALWTNLIWSTKESTLKALRCGLRTDPRRVEVDISKLPGESAWKKLSAIFRDDGTIFYGHWKVESGFVFTVVSEKVEAEPAMMEV